MARLSGAKIFLELTAFLILLLMIAQLAHGNQYDQTFYWKTAGNQPTISVGQYAQSDDFVINTIPGTVQMSSIEFYLSLMITLPADVTVTMAALYGTSTPSFNPGNPPIMQGLSVTFGPGAACGSSGYDFHLIVDFVARRTTVEPSWSTMQQCITKVVNYEANAFQSSGTFHARLAFYLARSSLPQNNVVINMSKAPRVRVVFSVAGQETSVTDPTKTVVVTTASTVTTNPTVNGQSMSMGNSSSINILPYAGIGGITMGVALLALFLITRRKERGTEIYMKAKQPGEKGTRVYGQNANANAGTRLFGKEKEKRATSDK